MTRPAALWLEERLHFPYWTKQSIETMPITKIGDWAERHDVPIEKLYAIELREGGTEALGTDIPAVAHDLLDAVPRDRWEREKRSYTYETWVDRAKAALTQP